MYLTKRLIAILLCVLLHAPIAMTQDRKADPQSNRSITPISEDVTIIVQQHQARFTAQKATEQMQLQVFDQWSESAGFQPRAIDSGEHPSGHFMNKR